MASNYEQEIEELLSHLGDFTPKESGFQKFSRTVRNRVRAIGQSIVDLPRTVAADQLMLTAILCIVAAFFLRFVLPGAARIVGFLGLALFLAAFFFSFRQLFGSGRGEIRWRGYRINMDSGQLNPLARLVLWVRRQFRDF